MHDEDAFLGGVVVTAIIVIIITFLCLKGQDTAHGIGWKQFACVQTTDRNTAGVQTTSTHCVRGDELAQWAQEHGR